MDDSPVPRVLGQIHRTGSLLLKQMESEMRALRFVRWASTSELWAEGVRYAGSSTCDIRIYPFAVTTLLATGTPAECTGKNDGQLDITIIFDNNSIC